MFKVLPQANFFKFELLKKLQSKKSYADWQVKPVKQPPRLAHHL